ncbi:hypothetical protein NQ318_006241 [Aromia moschata]|uniref:Uncharacterized protein n=1 Tax=Aromia moschata TaxID=1265417 RepID=A0AAV8XVG2_9CUCU|nr:hypothetical protein NQ318_006241 [Aromia moschata]
MVIVLGKTLSKHLLHDLKIKHTANTTIYLKLKNQGRHCLLCLPDEPPLLSDMCMNDQMYKLLFLSSQRLQKSYEKGGRFGLERKRIIIMKERDLCLVRGSFHYASTQRLQTNVGISPIQHLVTRHVEVHLPALLDTEEERKKYFTAYVYFRLDYRTSIFSASGKGLFPASST